MEIDMRDSRHKQYKNASKLYKLFPFENNNVNFLQNFII